MRTNRIVEVRMILQPNGSWIVSATKEFAEEHGGGSQVFTAIAEGANPHYALNIAKSMVTMTPTNRGSELNL